MQRITAIKIVTDEQSFKIGKQGDLNNKPITTIKKVGNFIPGFKTSYITDNNSCFLSYLQAYFDDMSNYSKYFIIKEPSKIKMYLSKKANEITNFLASLSKFLLIAFLILFPFIYYFYKSQNLYGGEIFIDKSEGLIDDVKIFTDSNGFSHINAQNENDSYFALGFVHAKERLWQMDFLRRTSRGKLSEIFGLKTLSIDRIIRSMGLNEIANKFEISMQRTTKHKNILTQYVNGINYYAKNFILPLEYKMFSAEWNEWQVSDSIALSNFMALTLTHDWNMEVWYKVMEDGLGKEFADLVISFRDMGYPFANETIVNDEELINLGLHRYKKKNEEIINQNKKEEDLERKPLSKSEQEEMKKTQKEKAKNKSDEELKSKQTVEEAKRNTKIEDDTNKNFNSDSSQKKPTDGQTEKIYEKTAQDTYNKSSKPEKGIEALDIDDKVGEVLFNNLQNDGASNSWVLSGNLTSSGFPILSNDPHLSNGMPSMFFVSKIYLPENTLVGATMPGLPFVLFGANKHISWGFTTENSDTADLCEEKIEDDEFYIYDNKRYQLVKTTEVINIKGSVPEMFEVSWTRNGPVLTESLPKEMIAVNLAFKIETPLSLRLSFFFFDFTSVDFYYSLNFAKSPSDFLKVVDKLNAPNLNLIYSSKKGEIGWIPLGKFPIKTYKNRFCRGYASEDDFKKFINRAELPFLKNPDKGFIITANNKLANFNYTYNLHGFHNHVRAFRIRELIENKIKKIEKFNIEDNILIMGDVKDSLAEQMLPKILNIVERNTPKNKVASGNIPNQKQGPMPVQGQGQGKEKQKSPYPRYYDELKNWNYTLIKNSQIPTVWSILELSIGKQLLINKVSDEKARGIMSMLHYWNFVSVLIDRVYNGERVDLKQCAHQNGNVNCEKFIVYVFNNLDKYIDEGNFRDPHGRIKLWGDLKFNYYPHGPIDLIPIVNKLFSRSVATDGNRNTVKISRGPFNHDKGHFISTHSPRFKIISDMKDPTRPHLVIDGGNSGSILSKFYDNLMSKHEDTELIQIDEVDFNDFDGPDANCLILKVKSDKSDI